MVNMNMMVNTSELVPSEAETKINSETATRKAISKLVASWEKKQATRAKKIGGFGLLAISLAACNSSSDDTATTTTTTTTPTTDTTTPAAPTVNNVTVDATVLNNFGTAGQNDVYAADQTTLTSNHKIIDSDTTDADVLNLTLTGDYSNTPTVIGIETINITTDATLAGGNTTLDVNVNNMEASSDTITFDVTSATSLIAALDLSMAGTNHYSTSSEFANVTMGTKADADVKLTVATDATVVVDNAGTGEAAGDDLTISGGTAHDITLTSSTAAENITLTGNNVTITAADSATGNLTITAATDAIVTSLDKIAGNVTITAGDDTTVTEAPLAAGTMTVNSAGTIGITASGEVTTAVLNNTGGTSGEDITVAASGLAKATSVTITSVGGITANGNALNVAETITLTAAEDSSFVSDTPANDQTITLNSDSSGVALTPEVTFVMAADDVTSIVLGGPTAIELEVTDANDITAKPITSTNSTSAAVLLKGIGGTVDVTKIATDIEIRLDNPGANQLTAAAGQTFAIQDTPANAYNAASEIDHDGTATSGSTALSTTLKLQDNDGADAGDQIVTIAGWTFNDLNTATIDTGAMRLDATANVVGDKLDTVVFKGAGTGATPAAVNFGNFTITGNGLSTTNDVVVDGSQLTGTMTMGMTSAANATQSITSGSGGDTINVVTQATGDSFTIVTNGGNDTISIAATAANANMTINGGSGTDTLLFAAGVDLDAATTLSLTSVEVLDLTGGGGASNIDASQVSGKAFILRNSTTDTAELAVIADQTTIDLSLISPDTVTGAGGASAAWSANDKVTVDGSAIGLPLTITGTGAIDVITGGGAVDTITGGGGADTINSGAGADSVILTETTDAADVVQVKDSATTDTVTGFTVGAGKDQIEISITTNGNISTIVNGDGADSAHGDAIALKTIAAGGGTTVAAGDNIFVLAGNFADTDAVRTAIIAGGDSQITMQAATGATNDDIMVLYDDGTNSHLAIVNVANAAVTINDVAGSTVNNLITFSGIADSSTFDATNFDLIA